MFKYKLYYDGGFLRDSAGLGYTFESEEEAQEDAEMDGCEYDKKLFEVIIEEV